METVLDLPPEEREQKRIELVNQMDISIPYPLNPYGLELIGTVEQAIAFVDLLYARIPKGRLAIIVQPLVDDLPEGLSTDNELATKINAKHGVLEVHKLGETALIEISCYRIEGKPRVHFFFTYCPLTVVTRRRLLFFRRYNKIDLHLENPLAMVKSTIDTLTKLTGNSQLKTLYDTWKAEVVKNFADSF